MERSLKVKVVKENANRVTLLFMSLNRKMPVSREEFEKRVEDGTYTVIEQDNTEIQGDFYLDREIKKAASSSDEAAFVI